MLVRKVSYATTTPFFMIGLLYFLYAVIVLYADKSKFQK